MPEHKEDKGDKEEKEEEDKDVDGGYAWVILIGNVISLSTLTCYLKFTNLLSNSYTMGCPPVRGDNPRALASGLSYVQVDKHGITILYHLHQCRTCTSQNISC